MAIIRNLLIRVGADIQGYQKSLAKAQSVMTGFAAQQKKALSAMSANTKNLTAGAGASMAGLAGAMMVTKGSAVALAAAAAAAFAAIATGIKPAMEYESSLQQVNRVMGESANIFVEWANAQAAAFNMSRVEAMKYGAVYGNLMGSITSSQAEAMQYTTDLLKASAVVASATGRTMEDTMSRIRSGLLGETEAVEDLGIQVQVAALEGTAAFQRFANGKSWEQLSFQTQQQVRYFAILEQAASKFGSSIYNNTASSLTQFTALLKDAQLNLGQAFLPVMNSVMPVLINFANGLKYVTSVFSQFMQALFGVKTKQVDVAASASKAAAAQTGLGNATKAAGKAAKGSLAAFDEINQLQEQMADSAGAAAGGISGGGMVVPDSGAGKSPVPENLIPQSILDNVEKFKKALEPLGNALKILKEAFGNLGKAIAENPIIQDFFERAKTFLGNSFKSLVLGAAGAIEILAGYMNIAAGILSSDFETGFKGFEQTISGFYDIVTGAIYPFFPEFAQKMQEFKKNFAEKWAGMKEDIKLYGDPAKLEASDFAQYIKDKVGAKFNELREDASNKWRDIKTDLVTQWTELKTNAGTNFETMKQTIGQNWEQMKTDASTKWANIKTDISTKWEEIKGIKWASVKESVKTVWAELAKSTDETWEGIKTTIKNSINWVIDKINDFIKKVNNVISKAGDVMGFSAPTIPEIPRLAKGGIVTSPTLAMVGEAGAEAVVPLENTSFVDTLASAIGSAVLNAMQFSQSGNGSQEVQAVFNLDGTQLARSTIKYFDKERMRRGTMAIQTT